MFIRKDFKELAFEPHLEEKVKFLEVEIKRRALRYSLLMESTLARSENSE